jgi:thiamine pyrophosphate-dependent acetolactate synthase large subunit-like protein
MYYDKPEGTPDEKVAWGSDVAAQMLRRIGFPYISLNPGASYRGFHDSIVNHLGNQMPSMVLCQHEDHSVAIAHGYAKATGEPMACVLHSNVGLFHGMMSLYNAWCDRAPMFVLGATGPLDAPQRRPWIDWIHSSTDQASHIRDFIKWDNQPTSPESLVEAMCRANMLTRAEPSAPVYIVLDAGLQEASLERPLEWPDLSRFQPPTPARPAKEAIAKAAAMLRAAQRPVVLMGRCGLSKEAWNKRVKLVERLGAVVMTDLKLRACFPTDHPAHIAEPFNQFEPETRAVVGEADVILSLDWVDLGGAVRATKGLPEAPARVIANSLDHTLHNGAHMNYMALAQMDVFMAAGNDAVVDDLLEALGEGPAKNPWRGKLNGKKRAEDPDRVSMRTVGRMLRAAFPDPENVTLASVCRGWACDLWPFHQPEAYLGKDGGGGLGSGPGISTGAALANATRGRHTVSVLGDGDFLMGASAVWSAVRAQVPLLILINNNRSYFNDELHQETVARRRNRPVSNRWIGQSIASPEVDIAALSTSYGAVGIGPVKGPAQLEIAIKQGVEALMAGKVAVIDIHVNPGQERTARSTIEDRKTD